MTLSTQNGFNFGGVHKQSRLGLFANSQLWNYWQTNLRFNYNAAVQNDRLTRGGPLMGQPAWGASALDSQTTSRRAPGGT